MMDKQRLVLVAEDSEILRFLLSKQLAKLGMKAEFAKNGSEAVEMAKQDYDVILMDISMPIMDGIEATTRIREEERRQARRRTPIIAVSAFSEQELARAAGMDDYLFKPVSLDDLRRALEPWLS
jgi:CheY-like chemotaxis protein